MIRWRPIRVSRTAGAALLAAVVVLCCADRADAECGDYVRLLGPDGRVQRPAEYDSAPTERPCQGPECTGGPKVPAPPTSPAPTLDVKGLVAAFASPSNIRRAVRPASDEDALPVSNRQFIFRPPRAS